MKRRRLQMNKYDVLLIDDNYIKSVTNISDNIAGDYLLPAIQLAQDIELEETIGTRLKETLQELVFDNLINTEGYSNYKYLLDRYIQPYLCYSAIAHLIPNVAHKIANAGVLRTDDEKMYNVSSDEVDRIKAHYKHIADVYKYRMQRHLIACYGDFPELMEYKSISDLRANLYSAAGCNLNLGGARGKGIANPSFYWGYGLPSSTIDIS